MFLIPLGTHFLKFPLSIHIAQQRLMQTFFVLFSFNPCKRVCSWNTLNLEGETSRKKKREEKGPSKNRNNSKVDRKSNHELNVNFGIKCFGHTILTLWFWMLSSKHPVMKGRRVVVFPFKFQQTVHHLPRQRGGREREVAFFFFFSFSIIRINL